MQEAEYFQLRFAGDGLSEQGSERVFGLRGGFPQGIYFGGGLDHADAGQDLVTFQPARAGQGGLQSQGEDGEQLIGDGDGLPGAGADDPGDFCHRVFGLFPTDHVEEAGVGLEDLHFEAGTTIVARPLARQQQEGQAFAGPLGEANQVE